MTQKTYEELEIGDIVLHANGQTFMITDKQHDHYCAVRTVHVTKPHEWTLLSKAQHVQQIP